MRQRLFWKILLGLFAMWITTFVVTMAAILLFMPQARALLNPGQGTGQIREGRRGGPISSTTRLP